jgi:hypothetical protein
MENLYKSSVFKLNKIAFNNSCHSNFVSLALDENTLILGKNASGKSSKLNGVQIGFLPHMNFRNIEKKFDFKSSKGNYYTAEETYDYYFPENNSYIIYEFSNNRGKFCQIVYKSKNELSIERAFVRCSLDEIYHWFFTFDDNDELGFPTNINRNSLIEKIKDQKDHKIIKTVADAKSTLYRGSVTDETGNFSIISVSENRIDNVIDIFKLSSNAANIDDNLLRKTIISLLENSYIDNSTDNINYDPSALMEDLDRLKNDKEIITKKKNLKPHFDILSSDFKEIKDKSNSLKKSFNKYYTSLESIISKNEIDIISKRQLLKKDQDFLDTVQKNGTELNSLIDMKNGSINTLEFSNKKHKKTIDDYKEILFGEDSDLLVFNTAHLAISHIEKHIVNCEDDLSKIKNIDRTIADLKSQKIELKSLNLKLTSCKRQLENNTNLLISKNILIEPSKLISIIPLFRSMEDNLSQDEIDIINKFVELFNVADDNITFNNVSFGQLEACEKNIDDLKYEEENLEEDIKSLDKFIANNQKIVDNEDATIKDKLRKEIKKSKEDIDTLREGSAKIEAFEENELKLNNDKIELKKLNGDLKDHRENWRKARNAKIESCDNVRITEKYILAKKGQKDRLNELKNKHGYRYEKLEHLTVQLDDVSDENMISISVLLSDCDQLKDTIKSELDFMVEENIISDENGLLKDSKIDYKILNSDLFEQLEHIYTTLDSDEDLLDRSFKRQADVILDISSKIKDQQDHIRSYVNKLNKELDSISLSSIDRIKLKIDFNPLILNFIKTIDSFSLYGDDAITALDSGISSKIRDFIISMKLEKNELITTEKLLSYVKLEYFIDGMWNSKDGSTGTSLVSSVMLLSLFISEICGKDTILSIPLNLDETGSVDVCNMDNLSGFLKDKNLVLFSASPEPQISSGKFFETLINFDDCIIHDKDRLMSNTNLLTYHYMMGGIMTKSKDVKMVSIFKDED